MISNSTCLSSVACSKNLSSKDFSRTLKDKESEAHNQLTIFDEGCGGMSCTSHESNGTDWHKKTCGKPTSSTSFCNPTTVRAITPPGMSSSFFHPKAPKSNMPLAHETGKVAETHSSYSLTSDVPKLNLSRLTTPVKMHRRKQIHVKPRCGGDSVGLKASARARNTSTSQGCQNDCTSMTLPFTRDETLIFFDWDDTLLPSSWLASKELTLEPHSSITALERDLLDSVASMASCMLQTAVQYGRVVIVTNAEAGWVELSASKFMPTVLETLEEWHISVISARSEFESVLFPHPFEWKLEAFKELISLAYPSTDMEEQGIEVRPNCPTTLFSPSSYDSKADRIWDHDVVNDISHPSSTDHRSKSLLQTSPPILKQAVPILTQKLLSEVEQDVQLGVLEEDERSVVSLDDLCLDDHDDNNNIEDFYGGEPHGVSVKSLLTKSHTPVGRRRFPTSTPTSLKHRMLGQAKSQRSMDDTCVGSFSRLRNMKRSVKIQALLSFLYLEVKPTHASSTNAAILLKDARCSPCPIESESSSFEKTAIRKLRVKRKNVISFGDSDSERVAVIQCVKDLEGAVYKSFKFCEHPTPGILERQLQLVYRLLPQIIHHFGKLDLKVNFKLASCAHQSPSSRPHLYVPSRRSTSTSEHDSC